MALSAAFVWEVRTAGSDSSGGGFKAGASGTDYSQQDAAQFSGTNLAVDAVTNTKVTSATHNFVAADVGNAIQITAGAGWTVGFYEIVSVAANAATLDRSPAATGTTGGTWAEGGALATIGAAAGAYVAGNTVWIKGGTYTLTATVTFAVSAAVGTRVSVIGYSTARGDAGRPIITSATNSVNLITMNNADFHTFMNLKLTHTAGTRGNGFHNPNTVIDSLRISNCIVDGAAVGISPGFGNDDMVVQGCEIMNCTSHGIYNDNGDRVTVIDCDIHDNAGSGYFQDFNNGARASEFINTIFDTNNYGFRNTHTSGQRFMFRNCTFVDNVNDGISFNGASAVCTVGLENDIFYGNGGWGVNLSDTQRNNDDRAQVNRNNAYGSNTSGARNTISAGLNDVALSADPFTNKASRNFGLNTTAGGGAACRAAGFPGAFPGGTTVGYLDIGAAQHQDAGGSSGGGLKLVGRGGLAG